MPEFLTEKNWRLDFLNCKDWIFGCDLSDQRFTQKISKLFGTAYAEGVLKYNNIHFTTRKEAEMVKYVRNCFLALKVSFFNEIEEFARKTGIHFETVRHLSSLDDRIGTSHTMVPGPDGHHGYGGTCFVKDSHALLSEMQKVGMNSYIVQAMITRNENVDRPEKDWYMNSGRAVV